MSIGENTTEIKKIKQGNGLIIDDVLRHITDIVFPPQCISCAAIFAADYRKSILLCMHGKK